MVGRGPRAKGLAFPSDSQPLWAQGWSGCRTSGLARVALHAHSQVQCRCSQRQESSPEVWKGFIGAALSPSQCYRNPLFSLLPLLFGDLGGKAGGPSWERKGPSLGLREGSGRSRKINMSRAHWGLDVDGAASQGWRSQSMGFVRGEVDVGGT